MKYFNVFLIIICLSCSTIKTETHSNLYRIKKIEHYQNYYVVYAVRNDSIFKIVSNIDELKENIDQNKIYVGEKYSLNLQLIFPLDSLFGVKVMPNLGIQGIGVKGGVVTIDKRTHYKLYKANNLSGLVIR